MDVVHPWLDPVEVRRMAERLLSPVSQEPQPPEDAGFGAQFVGYDSLAPEVAPRPSVVAVAEPEAEEPAVFQPAVSEPEGEVPVGRVVEASVPEPEPVAVKRVEGRGPFLDRVVRLRDWLHVQFQASGVFLLDRDGAVLFDESGHGRLHFLARSLAQAARRPGASSGNVHVKVGTAATLEVIPADTPYGFLVLGAVVPLPLEEPSIRVIVEALLTVASPKE